MILITRPQKQALNWAEKLERLGYETLISPVLEIAPKEFEMPDLSAFQALAFTSGRAVEIWAENSANRDIPAYAVGPKTEALLKEKGFKTVYCANGSAQDLENLLAQNLDPHHKTVLHVRGEDISQPLSNPRIEDLIVYKAHEAQNLSDQTIEALQEKRIEAIPFFSPRSAKVFINLATQAELLETLTYTKALCMSDAVLECVQTQKWNSAYVSQSPNEDAMTDLVQEICTS